MQRTGDFCGRPLHGVGGAVKSASGAPTTRRVWLPLQCDDGGQAGHAPHHGVFRMDAIYGSNDKRTCLETPVTAVRPNLQQAGMSTRAAKRRVTNPIVLHEATRFSGAGPPKPCLPFETPIWRRSRRHRLTPKTCNPRGPRNSCHRAIPCRWVSTRMLDFERASDGEEAEDFFGGLVGVRPMVSRRSSRLRGGDAGKRTKKTGAAGPLPTIRPGLAGSAPAKWKTFPEHLP